MNTLIWVIIWFWLLLLIAGIILTVFLLGQRSVKDKPNEAAVFVKTGIHISKPFKAKLFSSGNTGLGFFYGEKKIVFEPAKYKEHYYHNRRAIFVNHAGQLVASPFTDDVTLSDPEKEDLIYELCSGKIGADGHRAMRGKGMPNSIIIAVVAFVIGIAVVLGFNAFQEQMAKRQTNVPQQQAPIQIHPQEVK